MPPKPPSTKQLVQQRYQEVYNEVIRKGIGKLPEGPGYDQAAEKLHRNARIKAHTAAVELQTYIEVIGHPPSAAPAVQNPANQLLPKPKFKVSPLPVLLDIFESVVKGENEKVFRLLEHTVNTMREQAETIPILLVGPPSVGKTMTAEIIARAVDRPFLPLSAGTMGSKLFKVIEGPLAQIHRGNPFKEVYAHPDNAMQIYRIKPTTIFIDEAHELHASVQTALLVAMEKPFLVSKPDGGYFDFRDVLFLGGTTDPSANGSAGLVKSLRTRFTEVTFVHYGVGSVAKIIRRHYPRISRTDSELLARTAKLYPRTALRYAKQAGSMPMGEFIRDFLGADELGLDALDQRILALLEENQRPKNPVKVAEARFLLEQQSKGDRVTPAQLARARAVVEAEPAKAIGIAAIANKLMVTDLEDIQARVHYLETLGLVARTPQGVIRNHQEEGGIGAAGRIPAEPRSAGLKESAPLRACRVSKNSTSSVKVGRVGDDARIGDESLPEGKREILRRAIDSLEPRVRKPLIMRFGTGDDATEHFLEETGPAFPATRARIQKIEQKAARKLLRMAKKPSADDPLFGAAMGILDSLKRHEGAHAGKVKVGTALPMPIYEFVRSFPGKARQFFEDAIRDYDGDLNKLTAAAAEFSVIRQQARESVKVRWVDGWLEPELFFLLNELDLRMTERDGKKGSRALPGLLFLHLQKRIREIPIPANRTGSE